MREPDMQPRHAEPLEDQPVPMRRVLAWGTIALLVLVGIVLFFRYAPALNPLLGQT